MLSLPRRRAGATPAGAAAWAAPTSRDCASPTYTMVLTEGIHLRNSLHQGGEGWQQSVDASNASFMCAGAASTGGDACWPRSLGQGGSGRGNASHTQQWGSRTQYGEAPCLIQLGTVDRGTTTRKGPAICCTSDK